MAFKTFVDAVALPASDLNTYLMKQAVIVCTSGTRPASPVEGETIYETDTDKLLIYTTTTTLWQPPWNMPWGRVASATISADQTGIAAGPTDLTGLTVTFTAVANRRYKIHTNFTGQVVTSDSSWQIHCLLDTVDIGRIGIVSSVLASGVDRNQCTGFVISTPTSGSRVYKLTATRFNGTGTLTISAGSGIGGTLTAEDIGPNGAPA